MTATTSTPTLDTLFSTPTQASMHSLHTPVSPPAVSLPAAASAGGSAMLVDAPEVLYQTKVVNGKQDSASLQKMSIRLSAAALEALSAAVARGESVGDHVHGAIRRFDYAELDSYDAATGKIMGLRLPQNTFVFDLQAASSTLSVLVHRKELPVSRSYGDSPFLFVFFIIPVEEFVVTRKFIVASKQPTAKPARPPPKRVRGLPPRRPTPAPPSGLEAAINDAFTPAAKRVRVTAPDVETPAFSAVPWPIAVTPPPVDDLPAVAAVPSCPSPLFGLGMSPTAAGVAQNQVDFDAVLDSFEIDDNFQTLFGSP